MGRHQQLSGSKRPALLPAVDEPREHCPPSVPLLHGASGAQEKAFGHPLACRTVAVPVVAITSQPARSFFPKAARGVGLRPTGLTTDEVPADEIEAACKIVCGPIGIGGTCLAFRNAASCLQ